MRAGSGWRVFLAALLFVLSGSVIIWSQTEGIDPTGDDRPLRIAAIGALALLLVPIPLFSIGWIVERLRRLVDGRPGVTVLLAAGLVCPYLLYWAFPGNANPGGLFRLIVYAGAATFLALALPRGRMGDPGDVLVVLAIWLPIEFWFLDPAFPWPPGGSGGLLASVLGLDLLLFLMLVVRRFEGACYTLRFGSRDLGVAIAGFAAFALVGIPIGLGTGFIALRPDAPGPLEIVMVGVGVFLFTGIPEEVLFRGFIQVFLERWIGRPYPALLTASLLFGAAHLNNGPVPDWRYFLLATLAGLAYGFVFQRTRRIGAAAITHMLVDATWSLVFDG